MTTNHVAATDWQSLRTDESREVKRILGEHFESVDAYRYNSASLLIRIVYSHFRGLTNEQRDHLVEPALDRLDRETEADIMNLMLLHPGEVEKSSNAFLINYEFEHPTESML